MNVKSLKKKKKTRIEKSGSSGKETAGDVTFSCGRAANFKRASVVKYAGGGTACKIKLIKSKGGILWYVDAEQVSRCLSELTRPLETYTPDSTS